MSLIHQLWWPDNANEYIPACAHCERKNCPKGRVGYRYEDGDSGQLTLVDCSEMKFSWRTRMRRMMNRLPAWLRPQDKSPELSDSDIPF